MAVELPVAIIKEGESFIAYTPALDLSTCGSSHKQAQEMFQQAVQIFFTDLVENNPADDVLGGLCWTKDEGSASWLPPVIKQESIGVNIPVFA